MLFERDPESHKGQNGRVLVIGGSEDYVGAPALCGLAALRSGADLAVIAAPEKAAYAMNSLSPDLITYKLNGKALEPSHYSQIMRLADKADVVVIGPGLGASARTAEAVKKLCDRIDKPKVIDADALRAMRKIPPNSVLTPHAREFEDAFKAKPTRENLQKLAAKDRIILLKGHVDLISNGVEVRENQTGNAGMTHGGTGDVLAGLVAGFIAQKLPLFDAACLAAYVNGKAGDLLFERYGYCFIASDILGVIPQIMAEQD